jgi:hypothetical protein
VKITNIRIPYDLKTLNVSNSIIDIFVDTDEDYTYTISVTTPEHLRFVMDEEQINYYGLDDLAIIVNKLTPDIIEQTVRAFAKENNGYWLKLYHFAGFGSSLDESRFDQLRAEHIEELKRFDKLNALDLRREAEELMREAKRPLHGSVNKKNLVDLLEQYRSGIEHPSIGTRAVPGTCLNELRAKRGGRLYFKKENDIIEVVGISHKGNRQKMLALLKLEHQKKNNF